MYECSHLHLVVRNFSDQYRTGASWYLYDTPVEQFLQKIKSRTIIFTTQCLVQCIAIRRGGLIGWRDYG
uniref:Uncharacterized protein n=1 Tax=Lepeophtheirus salmonis TaxID=72036 RepID=A0A0K2TE27_LEPSM